MILNLSPHLGIFIGKRILPTSFYYTLSADNVNYFFNLYFHLVLTKPPSFLVSKDQSEILNILIENYRKYQDLIFPPFRSINSPVHYQILENKLLNEVDDIEDLILIQVFKYDSLNIYRLLKTECSDEIDFSVFYLIGLHYISIHNSVQVLEEIIKEDRQKLQDLVEKKDYYLYYTNLAIKNNSGSVWRLISNLWDQPLSKRLKLSFEMTHIRDRILKDIRNLYISMPLKGKERRKNLEQSDIIIETYLDQGLSVQYFFGDLRSSYVIIRLMAFAHNWTLIDRLVQQYAKEKEVHLNTRDILQGVLYAFGANFDHYSISNTARRINNFYQAAIKNHWLKYSSSDYGPEISLDMVGRDRKIIYNQLMDDAKYSKSLK